MRHLKLLVAAVIASLAVGSTAYADVQISMQDGRVSIVATDATVRQILAEWARVGRTKIVNGERVPGGPITIQLSNVPEKDALDVLLRAASGYVAAPRPVAVAGASVFDRILVLPTSTAPAVTTVSRPAAPAFQQRFRPPTYPQPADDDDDPEGQPAPNVVMPNRGPVFNAFPQPRVVNPQEGASPEQEPLQLPQPGSAQPGATSAPAPAPGGGVSVPGMVVPVPQQQQPGQPQPPRPRGGPGGPGTLNP